MHCPQCDLAMPPDARYCAACGSPIPGAVGPVGVAPKSGAWIVALVVVVVFGIVMALGIIAAVAIPNFLNALDRGRQKRTMADLRTISAAMERYAEHHGAYPVASSLEDLRERLSPEYIEEFPTHDGWGHALRARSDGASYGLVSPGKDGLLDGCPGGPRARFNDDICLRDGEFTQWPEGMRR